MQVQDHREDWPLQVTQPVTTYKGLSENERGGGSCCHWWRSLHGEQRGGKGPRMGVMGFEMPPMTKNDDCRNLLGGG